MNKKIKLTGIMGVVLLISACTSVPNDNGVTQVQNLVDAQIGNENEASKINPENALTQEQINEILDKPLLLNDAELLSMQLNPLAKTSIFQVGIAEADYAQAGRMENPGFSYETVSGGEYSSKLLFDIGGLLLMPLRRDVESRRLERARYSAAGSVIEHLANTRRAWVNAVSEKQKTLLMQKTLESAVTGNELTRQMSALGHSGVIDAAQSEIFLSEMRTALARQKLAQENAREALIRQLGIWGNQARIVTVPDALPGIPDSPLNIESVEGDAIDNRIDVQIAKANLESMAKNLSLTKKSPFLSSIELGPVAEKREGGKDTGYELELRIPIFDPGGVQNDKARFLLEQAQAQTEAVAIAAASNARTAYAIYQNSWEIAEYYKDVLLPLRRRISQEQMLMYNGMLISVFDLLDDVRSATALEADYVDATRDFWLADTNLQLAITGSGAMPLEMSSVSSPASSSSEAH